MKPISANRIFSDTNVLLYLASRDEDKTCVASSLLEHGGTISVQVLNEFVAVARRKLLLSWAAIAAHLAPVRQACTIVPLTVSGHDYALRLAMRYKIPIYDASILASAIGAGCDVLLTEDFQHGQLFERRLRVCNPFTSPD